jgi:hypothetical protein
MADYATLLRDRVALTCRSIDRLFVQAYVPKLQSVGQVCLFLNGQRGYPIPSSAAFGEIGRRYVRQMEEWANEHGLVIRRFQKHENKEAIARPLLEVAAGKHGEGQVVLLGTGQERAYAWRSWKPGSQAQAPHPHMEWGRQAVLVNHFYYYLWDPDWGTAFWKTNAYAPYPIWLWLNGHEWAKRQLTKAGIAYEALDNGFRGCEDPQALQRTCDRLGPRDVERFFWRWFHRLPSPFTDADLQAGYQYQLAVRQFEVSDTRVFDRPQSGRAFFEGLIRDHLDVGRPDQVALLFDRRVISTTPGTFRTRVIRRGVDPQVNCYYKSSRLKQYLKLGCALRTETVIGDTRDFGIGRLVRPQNWKALRSLGQSANQRLCDAELATAFPAPDLAAVTAVTMPSTTADGLHAPALRFGDPRVTALLSGMLGFAHLLVGFRNRQLTERMQSLFDAAYRSRQATYDLRRLRRKGLIERIPQSHRYQLTRVGLRIAVLFVKTQARILAAAFPLLDAALPIAVSRRSPLSLAWRRLDQALDAYIARQLVAA